MNLYQPDYYKICREEMQNGYDRQTLSKNRRQADDLS